MKSIGIDIGGTKIEVRTYLKGWEIDECRRVSTPSTYAELIGVAAELAAWAREKNGSDTPVGISLAGLANPRTGLAITTNLPASGQPLAADLCKAIGGSVVIENDCRAFAFSEALLGAGRTHDGVVGLIVGTGVGGGYVQGGVLQRGSTGLAGEYGHIGINAAVLNELGLPIIACNCGRKGCFETLVSGPGMSRISESLLGIAVPSTEICGQRHTQSDYEAVWTAWCTLVAELIFTLAITNDPDAVVLGGGLSKADGVVKGISEALERKRFQGLSLPEILTAEGGDASGARGAAMLAMNVKEMK